MASTQVFAPLLTQLRRRGKKKDKQAAKDKLLSVFAKNQLVDLCRLNNVAVSGNKDVLLDRLLECKTFNEAQILTVYQQAPIPYDSSSESSSESESDSESSSDEFSSDSSSSFDSSSFSEEEKQALDRSTTELSKAKYWTESDVQTLLSLKASKTTQEIGDILGRSKSAVVQKLRKLELEEQEKMAGKYVCMACNRVFAAERSLKSHIAKTKDEQHQKLRQTHNTKNNAKNGSAKKTKPVKVKEMKTGITNRKKPKKPMSSYFLYLQDMRDTVREQMPSALMAEITKEISRRWLALSDAEKMPYTAQAAILKHVVLFPLSAGYADTVREQMPSALMAEITKEISRRWLALSDAEKMPYTAQAAILKREYKAACKQWEASIAKSGGVVGGENKAKKKKKNSERKQHRPLKEQKKRKRKKQKEHNPAKESNAFSSGDPVININFHAALPNGVATCTNAIASTPRNKLEWSVDQVSAWVASLNKNEKFKVYAAKFKEEDVSGRLMDSLDDDSLGCIVSNPLHRKKIMLKWNEI
eukprot:CAMPEP_0197072676 /NCGR_PEP_ID=MMETSP1384-20130603/210217_1 /TAXON_ID=29189 /ORGANISM="Ammonia sp." /LENGTH=529 /DNA_ID=CAMNT_0042511497 /DNA_START=39 /DNA_END=1629 /DNA_ORIENTATION=+